MQTTTVAGVVGFLAVALGAFGAHALRGHLSAASLATYQTGVLYHLVHAAALLAVSLAAPPGNRAFWLAQWLFVAGIALFSGSLYVLAVSGIKAFGWVTPFGGLCLLGAWLTLAFARIQ